MQNERNNCAYEHNYDTWASAFYVCGFHWALKRIEIKSSWTYPYICTRVSMVTDLQKKKLRKPPTNSDGLSQTIFIVRDISESS